MAIQQFSDGEALSSVRSKINANFEALTPETGIAFTGVFDFSKYNVSFANYTTAGSITLSASTIKLDLAVNKVLIKGGITINVPTTWSKRGGAFSTDGAQWNEIYVQYEAGYITLVNTVLDANFQPIATTTAPVADTTAPTFVTTYPKSTAITASSFSIQVQLNEIGTAYLIVVPNGTAAPTSQQVKDGTASGSILSRSIAVTAANTTATMNATGVSDATNYDVYVVAEDDESTPNLQSSPVKVDVLTTASSGDTTPPGTVTGLASPSKTDTTVDLAWNGSPDNVDIVVPTYRIFLDGIFNNQVTTTSGQVTGLTALTAYSFTVSAVDTAGNESAQSTALPITTNAATSADTTAPSIPTNLASPSKTDTTVDLAWTASTDAVGVVSYNIFKGGVLEKNVPSNSGQVTGLTAETPYSFTVSALDAAGNQSAQSTAFSITTNAAASGGTFETETTAYMNAVAIPNDSTVLYAGTPQEITGGEIWTGIDNYIKEVKSAAFFDKMLGVYPIIGDTATKIKWNLKNPADTDAAFRLGVIGNGIIAPTGYKSVVTGYFLETYINPSLHLSGDNESIGFYARNSTSSNGFVAGALSATSTGTSFIIRSVTSYVRSQSSTESPVNLSGSIGLIAANRMNATSFTMQSRDVLTNIANNSVARIDKTFRFGAINGSNGINSIEFSFAYVSEGLTEAEMLAHNTAVENLQTALKRQV